MKERLRQTQNSHTLTFGKIACKYYHGIFFLNYGEFGVFLEEKKHRIPVFDDMLVDSA